MDNNISVKIVFANQEQLNGLKSLMLRIVKNRKKKDIRLKIKCKEADFNVESQLFNKSFPEFQHYNNEIFRLISKSNSIIEEYNNSNYDLTLEEFKKKLTESPKFKETDIINFFDEIIEELNSTGRTGNAKAYEETKKSLINFRGEKITFRTISTEFLEKYEVFLRKNGNKNGGISFKMRTLRAVFNKAIVRGIISQETYPFKFYKISKLKAVKNKRALTVAEIKRIINLDLTEYPYLVDAHNYFLFSFYVRGINFVDMMKLKWSDIVNNRIRYVRSKTKGSFNIEIIDKAKEILDYYKAQKRPSQYVFPILLRDDLTPIQIEYRKKKVLSDYNLKLKEIGELANVETKLTSYVARHSFATILKQLGTSVDKISELMGHSDVQVTMTYLKEFETEELDLENRKLSEL